MSTQSYRWIFVGGKGGVGKTTTACAVAVELAKRRESVLVLSTDPAHNLSDAFGQKLCGSPTMVKGFTNLFAMEIDGTFHESSSYRLRDDEGWSTILPELLQSLPGIDEAISFTELMHSVQSMQYSVIVFDTAPTGHTIRLLGFPDVLEQGLKKFIQIKNKLSGAIGMMNMVAGQTMDADDMSSKLDSLRAVTASIRETFQDPRKTTFICVCIAEFLSVFETERLVQELCKHNIDCRNIVVNQVLFPIEDDSSDSTSSTISTTTTSTPSPSRSAPSDVDSTEGSTDPKTTKVELDELRIENANLKKRIKCFERVYNSRRLMQSKYLQQIQDLYCFEYHIVCVGQQESEVRGVDNLKSFSRLLLEPSYLPVFTPAE